MISKLTVFHRGGAILWSSKDDADVGAAPVNSLIQNVLLNDRSGQDSLTHDSFTLKWTFANNFNLVFVAVFYSFHKLLYIDDLLATLKNEFVRMFEEPLKLSLMQLTCQDYGSFDTRYETIIKYFVKQHKSTSSAPKTWIETDRGKKQQQYKFNVNDNNKKTGGAKKRASSSDDDDSDKTPNVSESDNVPLDPYLSKLERIKSSGPRAYDASKKGKGKNKKGKNKSKKKGKDKYKKRPTDWGVWGKKASNLSEHQLKEFSMCDDEDTATTAGGSAGKDEEYEYDEVLGKANLEDSEDESDEDIDLLLPGSETKQSTSSSSGIWGRFTKLISNKALESEDLTPALDELERLLTSKNVTNAVARELCESVRSNLVGKQIGTFTTIKSTVKQSMTDALERILTPTRPINILHGIATARQQERPYTVVFIGVNGVGKSTSLSKVIHYLKSRNLKVSVAACDTFRSGAVEQLKTHCKALKVRLFQQGYAKDAAAVAYAAVREATKQKDDVVLIDTAGRMQNNEGLMRALTSLISRNNPDLVLFVGEALVGNDGVDQLIEFNKALQKFSTNRNPRVIDGIILTKFDTVDDKVGAAIAMAYESGKPIVFVGVGQHYPDLKRMHVKSFITKLLR